MIELKGEIIMGRPKGGKNRKYTVEEKLSVIRMNTEKHLSAKDISAITGIGHSNIGRWIKQYSLEGIDGLKPKAGKGNRFAALHTSKSLSKEERLELENLKLKIENERLKKGYLVKGGGAGKEYVSISAVNTRSSEN